MVSVIALCVTASAHAETLGDAVASATRTHPSAEAAQAALQSAAQDKREQRSAYFPTLSVSSTAGRIYGDNATSRGLSVTRGAGYSNLWNGSISARETIFNGFQTSSRIDSAKARQSSAAMTLDDVRESLAFRTAQAYIELLRTSEGLKLLQQHETKVDDYLSRIKKMVDEGASDEAELQQANDIRVILDGLIDDYEAQLRAAQSNYADLTGHFPDTSLALPVLAAGQLPSDLDSAVALARGNHPGIKAAEQSSISMTHDAKAEKGVLYPTVEGELSYMTEDKRDLIGGEIEDGRAVVHANWAFDTGGAQLARIKKKNYQQAEALSRLREVEKQIELGVRLAWSEYSAAQEQTQNQAKRRELNEKLFETYKVQFEGAKISLLQLMQGDNLLFTTGLEKMNGEYRLLTAQYALLSSMGKVRDSVGSVAGVQPAAGGKWTRR